MKISGIKWNNFKSFYGEYEITGLDSGLTKSNNIVLFGGTNGAGKTSLLESIFLCLYGREAKNLYPSRGAKFESYITYLHSLLNNKVREVGRDYGNMSIEIFLKDAPIVSNLGRDISIRRNWAFTAGTQEEPREILEILENGKVIDDIEMSKSEYQDSIHALLPFNVSQFFFFDGEKIQDFASDSDSEFSRSLKDVLGINLYSTLASDLKEVKTRLFKEFSKDAESVKEIKNREAKRADLESDNNAKRHEISILKEEIEQIDLQIESIDSETRRITYIDPSGRDAYLIEKNKKQEEKASLESDYINTAKDHLPFILASNLFGELLEQLDEEKRIAQLRAAQAEVEPKINNILDSVFNNQPLPPFTVTPGMRRYFEMKIDTALRDLLGGGLNELEEYPIIHNLSNDEADKVRRFIFGLTDHAVSDLGKKADRLKQVSIFLDKVQTTEARSGSTSDAIQGHFNRKRAFSEESGAKKERIRQLENELEANLKALETIAREITNWEKRYDSMSKNQKQLAYCEQLMTTVKVFQKEFQATKTAQLEYEILYMWGQLNHKPDLIKRVQILPDANFEVKLFNAEEIELDKTKLSAGEKEIFAISLLWALIQVSGKKLPILIDTPFGRLDSMHRRNLVKNYFPKASHQVILLSQDEEIVGEYYDILKPCIAQEFEVKNQGGVTTIQAGKYPFVKRP